MSRKNKKSLKRHVEPDARHGSVKLTKFINKLMLSGKKSTAQGIVYGALEVLQEKTSKPAIESFDQALKNVMPLMEVKSRRVGGSTYQVPMEVRPDRAATLAMRWLVANARSRSGRSMVEKLAQELSDAFNNTGTSVKKREDTHKMAEANKAFAHFRF